MRAKQRLRSAKPAWRVRQPGFLRTKILCHGPVAVIDSRRVGEKQALKRQSTRHDEEHPMEEYERLRELVEAAADDVAKAEGGNKAAGTRVRKTMQDVKSMAQEVRKKILEERSAQPGG